MQEFKNIDAVLSVLHRAINENKNIAVYGDYDVDGLLALMTWKDTLSWIGHKNTFLYPYCNRTHEIDFNFLNFCLANNAELVIINDTGSANMELLKRFTLYGMECVILDHHKTAYTYADFPEDCTVINTTIDSALYDIDNEMCGAGIAFVVCSALLASLNMKYDIGYLAVYAMLAQYADAIPMDTEFGRFIYETAQTREEIPACVDYFMERYNALTRRFAEYSFAPKINAVFRREQFSLINRLFINPTTDVFVTINEIKKIHSDTIETVAELVKSLVSNNVGGIEVADLTPFLNLNIPNKFVLNNKGRIANTIANRENAPCICVCDSGKMIEGSFRDIQGRDFLKYFAPLFKAGGHPPAFGFSLPYADWQYFNNTVRSVGEMAMLEGVEKVENPEYDMTRWFDLDMLEHIAYENEFASTRKPATYVRVNIAKVVEATKYGLAYLLHSDGLRNIWFASEKKIYYPQSVLLYPYLQKDVKVTAVWR